MSLPANLSTVRPLDPAELGFPPMLPVELAMRTAPVPDICAAYGLTKTDLEQLILNPIFIQAYAAAQDELKKEGVSFRLKAKLMAEDTVLKKVYGMLNNPDTPSAVQADLAKSVVRWAGYEVKDGAGGGSANNFQININLG